ncbi:GDSL-type esterase/lipase family protein [Paenibacillus sp. sgz500958]|uniref:GDSL-type esterase/lipase family protein n=1 Tax=Paenibacillus sp. sgz500958 TaxID=3242475 RepID=UPI0036D39190
MNDSKWTWRFISLISIASTLVFLLGFGYAVKDIMKPQGDTPLSSLPRETAAPAAQDGSLKVVAIGDSLAKGTGDNSGDGFVRRAVTGLSKSGNEVKLLGNLGINGLTTADLRSRLEDEGVQYTLRQANTILLSIGGNDLFRGAGIIQSEGAGNKNVPSEEELTPESLLAALPEASVSLRKLLEQIEEINPDAQIYYLGLYNPFGDIPELQIPGNQAVTAWNNAAMDIINKHSNMTLVPTFDLFHNHLEKYLSSDHFHPSGEGYQRIADRIAQAVR